MGIRWWSIGLLLLALGGCQLSGGVAPTPLPTAVDSRLPTPGAEPTQRPVEALAEVTSVEVISEQGSDGLQLTALVRGVLPDSCTQIVAVDQQRQGGNFRLELTTRFEATPNCAATPREFEERVPLDILGLTAGFYAISANGISAPYTFEGSQQLAGGLGSGTISGRVWHDLCAGSGQVVETLPSGCQLADGVAVADGVRQPDEPGLQNVQVGLVAEACPLTVGAGVGLLQPTDPDGHFSFPQLPAGSYCVLVGVDPLRDPLNAALLLPGAWSQGSGQQTVELAEGEVVDGIEFGWDYARLPRALEASACEDKAFFIEDVTIPDGTLLRPGQSFEKVWRVENIGTCIWDETYSLLPLENSSFQVSGALESSAPPTAQIEIRLTLTAPTRPGTYIGRWFIKPPEGEAFAIGLNRNNALTVQIVVPVPPGTPTAEPTPEE